MALTFRSASGANGGSSSASSFATTLPTGWAAGDLVVVGASMSNAGTFSAVTGWTLDNQAQNSGSAAFNSATYYRIMQAGDTAPTIANSSAGKYTWVAAAFTPGAGETISLDVEAAVNVNTTAATAFTAERCDECRCW